MRACVRARARTCEYVRVRACVRARARVCVCVCVRVRARARVGGGIDVASEYDSNISSLYTQTSYRFDIL